MSDIVKSKEAKAVKELDAALAVIEQADEIMKKETELLRSSPKLDAVTEEKMVNSIMIRVVAMPIAGGITIGGATAMMGFEAASVIPFALGMATALSTTIISPNTLARVFTRKQYKKYEAQRELNKMLRDISAEEYDAKEQEILAGAQKALKTANKILKEQDKEIVYSRGEGFIVKSSEPVPATIWDGLRIETMRHKGIESIPGARAKALTT